MWNPGAVFGSLGWSLGLCSRIPAQELKDYDKGVEIMVHGLGRGGRSEGIQFGAPKIDFGSSLN